MTEEERRNVLEQHLREHLLGPGYAKELIPCRPDCSDEVLDQDPTDLYVTGIIASNRTEEPDAEQNNADDKDNVAPNDGDNSQDENEEEEFDDAGNDAGDSVIEQPDRDRFGPTDHIGLITCVDPGLATINVTINYAKYHRVDDYDRPAVRVNMSHMYPLLDELLTVYDNDDSFGFSVNGAAHRGDLHNFVGRDDAARTVWFTAPVSITTRLSRDANQTISRDYRKANGAFKTLFRPFYKRIGLVEEREVDVTEPGPIRVPINNDITLIGKVFVSRGKKYVKLLVRNIMDGQGRGRYRHCLFQTELKVTPRNGSCISYTEPISFQQDNEGQTLDFIYRNVKNFGKGISCAVEWDENGAWIKTSYLPKSDVKKFSNELDAHYCAGMGLDRDSINQACRLLTLSHWTDLNENDYIALLDGFVHGYDNWCRRQQAGANALNNAGITDSIIAKQQELLARLKDNVQYLRDNREALACFKLANTAMLIQMTIARNEHFQKNRLHVDEDPQIINRLAWFRTDPLSCKYYPFQLAFLLMNVKSTFVPDDRYHRDVVDLIWFPTGGGKTEAYLALTAMTIIARRRSATDGNDTGVSVIMRYTLRLLTSQQFERASYLICALEFMRRQVGNDFRLGRNPITIGLWIGNSGATQLERRNKWGRFDTEIESLVGTRAPERLSKSNPYPVSYCPWCGQRLVTETGFGYSGGRTRRDLQCLNPHCSFHAEDLPIYFVDDDVRRVKPTLLFATVDKFALLHSSAPDLFTYDNAKSPDLIIQDELHLISGPLGSLVGLFESVVEKVCSTDGRTPKIIASTATTRNTDSLIRSLYNREARVFPAQGINYDDNYFSHIERASLRRHLGLCPQGYMSPIVSEVHLIAQIVLGRIALFKEHLRRENVDPDDVPAVSAFLANPDNKLIPELDIYWPLVLYYNSLKDLGRTYSRVAAEIRENVRAQQRYLLIPESLDFIIEGMSARTKEFTSREDSSKIKDLLTNAQSALGLSTDDNGKLYVSGRGTMDIILATNMISVGIDIDRWNIMMMSGQPRSVSEYIQSSSRSARRHKGLVVNLYSPMRNREYSMFENFTSFHESYYKYVEPLSATPITLQTLNHPVFKNIVLCYRRLFPRLGKQGMIDELRARFGLGRYMYDAAYDIIDEYWDLNEGQLNPLAISLRDIDVDDYLSINDINYD